MEYYIDSYTLENDNDRYYISFIDSIGKKCKLEINKKIFEIYMNSKSDYRRAENFYSRYEEHFEMTENEIYNKSFLNSKSIEEIIEQQMNGVANHLK